MASRVSVHEGENLRRIREILQIKQTTLAIEAGMSQQSISKLEQTESIDPHILERIANALGVSASAIRNYSEENTVACLSAVMKGHVIPIVRDPVFNKYDRITELYEQLLSEKSKLISQLSEQLERQKRLLEKERCT